MDQLLERWLIVVFWQFPSLMQALPQESLAPFAAYMQSNK